MQSRHLLISSKKVAPRVPCGSSGGCQVPHALHLYDDCRHLVVGFDLADPAVVQHGDCRHLVGKGMGDIQKACVAGSASVAGFVNRAILLSTTLYIYVTTASI